MKTNNRILIVEDDTLVSLDIARALTQFGYDVSGTTDTGEGAIAAVEASLPDLILMDVGLKGKMDGIEAARAIASSHSTPIVFLTADLEEGTLQRAKLSRPYGYLLKPFDPRELRSAIEIALHRAATVTPSSENVVLPGCDVELAYELSSPEERATMLAKLPLFRDLSAAAFEAFTASASERRFEASEYIVNEGSNPSGGFIVLSGRVGITKTSLDGKELIVASLAPGSTYGLLFTLKEFAQSAAARCQIESRVLWIPTRSFELLRADNPDVALRFTEDLAHGIALSHQLSSSLAHSKVEGRIVAALLALLPEFGRSGGAENQGRIYMTRRELADLVGTTPETAVRVTKTFERSGLLDLTRPGIIKILDIERLGTAEFASC